MDKEITIKHLENTIKEIEEKIKDWDTCLNILKLHLEGLKNG
jgi:hypothetical protein